MPTGTETTAGVPIPCIRAAPKPNAETKPPSTALEKTSPASTSKTPSKMSPSTSETPTSTRPTMPMTKNVVIGLAPSVRGAKPNRRPGGRKRGTVRRGGRRSTSSSPEHCEGESPCFVEWALGVAGDEEVLAWVDAAARAEEAAQHRVRRGPVARRPGAGPVRRAAGGAPRRRRHDPRDDHEPVDADQRGRPAGNAAAGLRVGGAERAGGADRGRCECGAQPVPGPVGLRLVDAERRGGARARRRTSPARSAVRPRCRPRCPRWPGAAAST